MKKLIVLILALAAVLSLSAGDYHTTGMKYWATGSYTITVETPKRIHSVDVLPYDNPIKVVAYPSADASYGAANGDTLQVPAGTAVRVRLPNANTGFQIIRDGGATTVLATWGEFE